MSLEIDLLLASGVNENRMKDYIQKLNVIQNDFERYCTGKDSSSDLKKAELLHDYFFEVKPNRYIEIKPGFDRSEYALFHKIIDSQISINPNQKVGNCLGLTSLYNTFLDRMEINNYVIEFKYPQWSHCMSGIDVGNDFILVENCNEDGFNIKIREVIPNSIYLLRAPGVLIYLNYQIRSVDAIKKNNFWESVELDIKSEKIGVFSLYRLFEYGYFEESII